MKTVKLVSTGEVKTATDGRQYYAASFQDPSNPFGKTVTRLFWQQKDAAGTPIWKGGDPEVVKNFVNKTIPGEIKTAKVEAYDVNGNTATTYTTVLLGAELAEQVFKSLGHPLTQTEAVPAAEAEMEIA